MSGVDYLTLMNWGQRRRRGGAENRDPAGARRLATILETRQHASEGRVGDVWEGCG